MSSSDDGKFTKELVCAKMRARSPNGCCRGLVILYGTPNRTKALTTRGWGRVEDGRVWLREDGMDWFRGWYGTGCEDGPVRVGRRARLERLTDFEDQAMKKFKLTPISIMYYSSYQSQIQVRYYLKNSFAL